MYVWDKLFVRNKSLLFASTSFIMVSMSLSVGFIPKMAAAFINSRRDSRPSPFRSILWKDSLISETEVTNQSKLRYIFDV